MMRSRGHLSAAVASYIAILALLCLTGAVVSAATLNVPADYGTIHDAIDAAIAGDEVVLAEGRYYETVDFNGKAITVRSSDPANPAVVAATVIDGQDLRRGVTFTSGEGAASALCGLTITNGRSAIHGGGIYCCNSSTPTIVDNTITGNSADGNGGGIGCEDNAGPLITGNTITGNSAGAGGGIFCYCANATITDNTITENSATNDGGGICSWSSEPTITGNDISGNSAGDGGGIHCRYDSSPLITENTIIGNSATASGGGIACETSTPTITTNTINGNSAENNGAGIYCRFGSGPTITNNTISENSADWNGGGIYCYEANATTGSNAIRGNSGSLSGGGIYCYESSPTISNTTISHNSTPGAGGGIYCVTSSDATITNTTISHNSADTNGGGILSWDSALTIRNSIVAFSTSGEGIYKVSGEPPQVSYCSVYGNAAGNYGGMPDPTGSDGNIAMNPRFAAGGADDYHLKSSAGRWDPNTQTWVPGPEHSPCIDAGDPASPYVNEPEPNGERINMGAYGNTVEASKSSAGTTPPATPTDLTATLSPTRDVDLAWTDNADNEDCFTVQRRQQNANGTWPAQWTTLRWLCANVTFFTDDEIPEDAQYQYRVRGYNAAGPGNWARPARVVVCSSKPPTPTDFAVQLIDDSVARLTWTDNSDINAGFTLQRRRWTKAEGWPPNWTTVKWIGPNVETYDDTLTDDGIYQYRIRAYNSIGPSNWAKPVRIVRATARPDPPSDLALTAVATGIRANWIVNADNAQGYTLQKRKRNPDGTWPDFDRPAKWLGPTVYTFTDTNLSGNGTYQFRVRAYNSQGASNWAPYARIDYAGPPGMPGALCSVAVTQANGQFVSIVYGLSAAAAITIEVRNIAGRLVRTIPCGTAAAGLNTATWNLRNATGASVPSGMYLCTITARAASGTQATAVRTVTIRR